MSFKESFMCPIVPFEMDRVFAVARREKNVLEAPNATKVTVSAIDTRFDPFENT